VINNMIICLSSDNYGKYNQCRNFVEEILLTLFINNTYLHYYLYFRCQIEFEKSLRVEISNLVDTVYRQRRSIMEYFFS